MTITSDLPDPVATFLRRAVDGDGRACTRQTLDLLDDGIPPAAVIVSLLAAAQREAGELWQRNDYTVSDEHLVSSSTQKALDALANTADPPPPVGLIVVACAEGDWHSLPAQMFTELLRTRGFNALFLGASIPADHVAALLARRGADALAVSCNLPIFYNGVTRLADAAHHLDIPVIAGGRALGNTAHRALRLGADAWAPDIHQADTILRSWQHHKPPIAQHASQPDARALQLDNNADHIAEQAFTDLAQQHPAIAAYTDDQLARTKEDLAFIVRFAAAALLANDRSVFAEFIQWLQTVLAHRGIPTAALHAGISALRPILNRHDPRTNQLTSVALAALTRSP